jgi:DNA polymerase I
MTNKNQEKNKGKGKSKDKRLIILLDVHALLHRAYHALPDFKTKSGEPTGALYGLSTMVVKLATDFKPDYMIACYDLPEKTHRHIAYEAYKAKRAQIDDDLIKQIISSRDLFETFNIPIYESPGFEADDILGTIVEQVCRGENNISFKDISIVIASGDMDTLQLVDEKKVKVFTLKRGITDTVIYDEEAVLKRFGFPSDFLPDYKGLRGDPSDNIIGVPGIGEKTATTLICQFGTLEDLYKILDKDKDEEIKKAGVSDRIISLLKEHKEDALFSKMLATIRRDAPIEFDLPNKTFKEGIDMEKIEKLFQKLEFRVLGQRFRSYAESGLVSTNISVIPAQAGIQDQSSNVLDSRLRGNDKAYEQNRGSDNLSQELIVALHLLRSTLSKPTLGDLLEITGKKQFQEAEKEVYRLIKEYELVKVFEEVEKPLIPVLAKMKERGVKIDVEYLKELSKTYHKSLNKLEKNIWQEAGTEFNINSPKQLGEILFSKLNLQIKGLKKTAGGAQSTRESELAKLVDVHPIISLILEYREINKLLTTYIDVIPKLVDENDRLHADFIQTGAVTGRLSSENPNLQNIPIKSELGRNIRKGFIAEKDFVLASFDYSQIELRIAAILSEDPKLMEIFKTGQDVHTAVAAQVFKVSPGEVTSEMRRKAKVINFGILFGMGVNALKTNLGGTREEAKKFYEEYFQTFTTFASWMERIKRDVKGTGYTTTLWGRRRYFPEMNSPLPYIRASAERMAINAPIQGTEADLIKKAMVIIDGYITKEKLEDKVYLLLQVHDELVYEIKEEYKEKVSKDILNIMENIMTKKETKDVPIIANVTLGKTWEK